MTERKFLLLVGCLLLAGCASVNRQHFFGFHVEQSPMDADFVIRKYDGKDVQYDSSRKGMDPGIRAWAKMDYKTTVIVLKNESTRTVRSDYFFDKFELVTKTGRTLELKTKQTQLEYNLNTGNGSIKPGQKAKFILETPLGIYHEDVAKIVCRLGVATGARIVLKPLPEIEIGGGS